MVELHGPLHIPPDFTLVPGKGRLWEDKESGWSQWCCHAEAPEGCFSGPKHNFWASLDPLCSAIPLLLPINRGITSIVRHSSFHNKWHGLSATVMLQRQNPAAGTHYGGQTQLQFYKMLWALIWPALCWAIPLIHSTLFGCFCLQGHAKKKKNHSLIPSENEDLLKIRRTRTLTLSSGLTGNQERPQTRLERKSKITNRQVRS